MKTIALVMAGAVLAALGWYARAQWGARKVARMFESIRVRRERKRLGEEKRDDSGVNGWH